MIRSAKGFRTKNQSTSSTAASQSSCSNKAPSGPLEPTNETITVAITETSPKFPTIISWLTMRLRTGWLTMASDSEVVKPAPVNAERAWKRATCSGKPVRRRATAPVRLTRMEIVRTVKRVNAAIMALGPM